MLSAIDKITHKALCAFFSAKFAAEMSFLTRSSSSAAFCACLRASLCSSAVRFRPIGSPRLKSASRRTTACLKSIPYHSIAKSITVPPRWQPKHVQPRDGSLYTFRLLLVSLWKGQRQLPCLSKTMPTDSQNAFVLTLSLIVFPKSIRISIAKGGRLSGFWHIPVQENFLRAAAPWQNHGSTPRILRISRPVVCLVQKRHRTPYLAA